MKRKVALYIRVSTDAQFEEGYSVEAQKQMLEGYCASKGIKNYEFYIDGGFTGSNIERPEMQRLVDEVKRGLISGVVVYKLDRLSRSQKDTLYLIEDVFNPHQTSFTSLNENMDTSTPMGRAMLGILSAFAQLERETIRERTRMGMMERVKLGYWPGGGRTPFGYDYDSEQGILVPNGDAETVRRIYELYLRGYSTARIARMVGMKYDRLVLQILTRKSNTGVIEYNGQEYPGRHQPLISRETYERAMEMMQRRGRQPSAPNELLLSGLLYCGKCGAKMRYQKWGKRGHRIYCYSQQKSKDYLVRNPQCDNMRLWAGEVERAVIEDLMNRVLEPVQGQESPQMVEPMELLKSRRQDSARRLRRLYALYAEREDEILRETIAEEKKQMEEIERQIEAERQRGSLSQRQRATREKIAGIRQAWPMLSAHERQEIVRECIEKVVITDGELDIHYRI